MGVLTSKKAEAISGLKQAPSGMEDKVKKWIDMAARLKSLKLSESIARQEIADHILQEKLKGAKKGTIGPYILTATGKLNQKIDKDALKAIWKDITPAERQAVRFDPKLIAAEYKKLPDKAMINQVITEKPGLPGLELKGVIE